MEERKINGAVECKPDVSDDKSCGCCSEASMKDIMALNTMQKTDRHRSRKTKAHDHSHDRSGGHDHDHDHDHSDEGHSHSHGEGEVNKKPLVISLILFSLALIIKYKLIDLGGNSSEVLSIVLFLAAWLVAGKETLLMAAKDISKGRLFDEGFLMSIATIGAIAIREYPEAAAVMIFYQVGEYFQNLAVYRSKKSIAELMDIRPDFANRINADGTTTVVDPEELKKGDIIQIKGGEKVPVDGIIIDGSTAVDKKALTGESLPVELKEEDPILSGAINLTGLIKVRVEKEFGESTVSKILELVENASSKKSNHEKFITRFSKVYTPIVVALAVLIAIIPPLFMGEPFVKWFERSLIFLVISCPCALVISVPLSFFAGIGGASKRGILFKGSSYIELLSYTKEIMFDKTGTITKGQFEVADIMVYNGASREEVLELAAYAEKSSNHPIAISVVEAYTKETGKTIDTSKIQELEEKPGYGIRAIIDQREILAGNAKLMVEKAVSGKIENLSATSVYVARDKVLLGLITIEDKIKEDSVRAIKKLNEMGIITTMLTGDNQAIAEKIGKQVGVTQVFSDLLPQDKVEKVEQELKKYEGQKNKKIAFVGDGINDAPVLARADIGIAMGGVGSDAAIEAADIVLMTDELSKIDEAIIISEKTMRIAKQNIVFAIGIKIIVMLLGTVGIANMWMAVFADVGVSLIAVLNSMRILKIDKIF